MVGEQALIEAVERANKLQILVEKTQDGIPDEQKMTAEEFAVALEAGLVMDLRMFLTVLSDLPDPEGRSSECNCDDASGLPQAFQLQYFRFGRAYEIKLCQGNHTQSGARLSFATFSGTLLSKT